MHQEEKDLYPSDDYYQGNSFGSNEATNELILEAKDQEIRALRAEIDDVKGQLQEYKQKEIHLCELIQRLADRLKPRPPESGSGSRETIRGKQEILLPFLSQSSKNWEASLRSTSPSSRPASDANIYGLLEKY